MTFFNHIFYLLHRLASIMGNEGIAPFVLAFISTMLLPWANFLTIIYIVEIRERRAVGNSIIIGGIYIVLLVAGFIYFFTKQRAKRIIESHSVIKNKRMLTITVIIYIIATVIVHFYFLRIVRNMFITHAIQ